MDRLDKDCDWGQDGFEKMIWHCTWSGGTSSVDWNKTIVYPFILSDGFDFPKVENNDYWEFQTMDAICDTCNQISSTLPLVSAMGAKSMCSFSIELFFLLCFVFG